MKKLSFQSFTSILSLLICGLFLLNSNTSFAQNNENKNVWIFTNSTGQDANDLHMEFHVGCLPTNLPADDNGIRRAGGVFVNFPTNGSPSRHDYSGGEVENGESITLQFDNATRLKKWWWTKDGRRIGNIERANSEDLSTIAFEPVVPNDLEYITTGTNQTTDQVANLSVHNPTDSPAQVYIPICYIPSDGKYQSYVITSEVAITVGANETMSIPLHGYCADIYKPAAPLGLEMPDISTWIFEDENYLETIPLDKITDPDLVDSKPGDIRPLVPGTEMPITANINAIDEPELFAQLSIAAFKNLKEASLNLQDELKTIDTKAIIQQSGWIYTAALTGNDYKIEQLKENGRQQFEASTGKKLKNAPDAVKEEFEEGVQNLWDNFKLVGQEAKVLEVTPETADNAKGNVNDLPPLIRRAYQTYSAFRELGNSHTEAMRRAFANETSREAYGDTFKELYEG